MTRLLYRGLVSLHPPGFRARFGAEMLCTFDEAINRESLFRMAWDACISLLRQWLLRENVWKYPVAAAIAAMVVITGMRLPVAAVRHHHPHPETASAEFFLIAVLAALIAVTLTTVFCVYWFRMATRLRRP